MNHIFSCLTRIAFILTFLFQVIEGAETSSRAPAKIIFLRHAEKVHIVKSNPNGLAPKEFSVNFSENLNVKGYERAYALGYAFSQNKFYLQKLTVEEKEDIINSAKQKGGDLIVEIQKICAINPLFATPDVLYAEGKIPKYKAYPEIDYVRSKETLTPLALQLGLDINTTYTRADEDEKTSSSAHYLPLAKELMNNYPQKVILLCWSHDEFPAIGQALNLPEEVIKALQNWPSSQYDQVWVVNYNQNGSIADVVNFSQQLMLGDSTDIPKRYLPKNTQANYTQVNSKIGI